MITLETVLVVIAFVSLAALVIVCALWRSDSRDADQLAEKLRQAEAKVRHYQRRNAELRDEVDAFTAAPDPSLVEAIAADLAAIDITYPGDQR